MRFWWLMGPNELGCDLDLSKSGLERLLWVRARIRAAKTSGALKIERYWFFQSETQYHWHLMVKLRENLNPYDRLMWEARFMDSTTRMLLNFARLRKFGRSWSLLISPVERGGYWRPHDHACSCPGKHRGDVMKNCPVAKMLKDCTLNVEHFGNALKESDPLRPGEGCEW